MPRSTSLLLVCVTIGLGACASDIELATIASGSTGGPTTAASTSSGSADPCASVSCNPPSILSMCLSGTTLRTYADVAGTCAAGVCSYDDFVDMTCPFGCAGFECLSGPGEAVSAGCGYACAYTFDDAVACWGTNTHGVLGNGSMAESHVPVTISGSFVQSATAAYEHTCAVTPTSGVECWGHNSAGQLGDGTTNDSDVPVAVQGLSAPVITVAGGIASTCGLMTDGSVACWGANNYGVLGDGMGSETSSLTPVGVVGISSAIGLASGAWHACAIMLDHSVRCWGHNGYGQLGNGSMLESVPTPVEVAGLSSRAYALAAGTWHTCAIVEKGAVKCWGRNGAGQLGDGTTTSRDVPVDVVGLSSGVVAISAKADHTCAVTIAGAVECWGENGDGELGDGSMVERHTPVGVVGLSAGVATISTGCDQTCATLLGSGVKCWGANDVGQLGNGSTTQSSVPVDVFGF